MTIRMSTSDYCLLQLSKGAPCDKEKWPSTGVCCQQISSLYVLMGEVLRVNRADKRQGCERGP